MSQHTPGPWTNFDNEFIGAGNKPWDSNWKSIAGMSYTEEEDLTNPLRQQEQIANAHLIAAAPELLEACRRLLKFNEELCQDVNVSTHYPSAEFAHAAIAKAEGRS